VSNAGDIVLTNVLVFSGQPGNNTAILGPIELAPGESEQFTGSYLVTAGSDPSKDVVSASGMDTCQARIVNAQANCAGPVTQGNLPVVSLVNAAHGAITISWTATPGLTYCLQFKSSFEDATWTNLPGNITASGNTAWKEDVVADTQRIYRVMVIDE
jgi:hypothetical protein